MVAKKRFEFLGVLVLLLVATLACGLGDLGGLTAPAPAPVAPPGGTAPTGEAPAAAPPGGEAQPAGGEVDACALFSQQAAETLFGAPSQPGAGSGDTVQGIFVGGCTYYSADNAQLAMLNLTRNDAVGPPAERFALISGSVIEPVPGLGDNAIWDGDHGTLNVAKGPWTVSITATLTGGASATKDQLTPIAQQVVAGLP